MLDENDESLGTPSPNSGPVSGGVGGNAGPVQAPANAPMGNNPTPTGGPGPTNSGLF